MFLPLILMFWTYSILLGKWQYKLWQFWIRNFEILDVFISITREWDVSPDFVANTKLCSLANGYCWQQNTVWMWKTGIVYVACSYHVHFPGVHDRWFSVNQRLQLCKCTDQRWSTSHKCICNRIPVSSSIFSAAEGRTQMFQLFIVINFTVATRLLLNRFAFSVTDCQQLAAKNGFNLMSRCI